MNQVRQDWKNWGKKLSYVAFLAVGSAIAITSFDNYAKAQINPDTTLTNNSTVTTQGRTSLIEGGTQRGNNLFHSFTTFSVPTGNTAYFNNASSVRNIFSRVTGGSISNIDGVLKANGNSNLFFLNPNGIIFGPNASLNIGGSFIASTANSLIFADGTQFSATASQNIPLLTVNVPIGLQFGYNPGKIIVKGQGQSFGSNGTSGSFDSSIGLQVQPGQTLALVGGDVQLDGGLLQAPGGRVELGGLSGTGTVTLKDDGSLSFASGVTLSDVSLINQSGVNVLAGRGGSIAVNGRNIDISGASLLSSGITTNLGEPGNQAGDITLNGTGNITLKGSRIENNANQNAIGSSGNINVTAGSLSLSDNAALDASTNPLVLGNAGALNINVRDRVSLDNSLLLSVTGPESVGKGGDINITTGSLSLTNNAALLTDIFGRGNGGNININARDNVSFNSSGVESVIAENGVGNSGAININAGSLLLNNESQFNNSVASGGRGNAGGVNINARDTVTLDGGFIFSRLEKGGVGKGGDINITAKSVSVTGVPSDVQAADIGQLVTATFGQGNAGNVTIKASDTVSFDGKGSDIFSLVALDKGIGNGGNIKIDTRVLKIMNGARLVATSETGAEGNAGNITINSGRTLLGNYSSIGSGSTTNQAGNIDIRGGVLVLFPYSVIATATSVLNGGNITIKLDDIVLLPASSVTANAETAFGGKIVIDTKGIIDLGNETITATGGNPSLNGTVQVNASATTDPNRELVKLPSQLVDVSRLIAQGCPVNGNNAITRESRFTITGNGGLPPTPRDTLSNERLLEDWGEFTFTTAERSPKHNNSENYHTHSAAVKASLVSDSLVEAQGWIVDEHGDVVLTATANKVTQRKPWLTSAGCHEN